jgi:hypothetical protein
VYGAAWRSQYACGMCGEFCEYGDETAMDEEKMDSRKW